MSEKIQLALFAVAALLLLVVAQRYFDPPAPEICLDGGCQRISP